MTKTIRAALYLRVSTRTQTTDNQLRDLKAAAEHRGWEIVAEYADQGISGAKSRNQRPQLDAMLKDAIRGKFDVAMVWSVDRLGRSLTDLIGSMQELHAAKVDLFLHQQGIDTTTPAGKAMFQMLGVFAEFERTLIVARVRAGMEMAQEEEAQGKVRRDAKGVRKLAIGRPALDKPKETAIRELLGTGVGMLKIAKQVGVGSGTVQRIKREMTAS